MYAFVILGLIAVAVAVIVLSEKGAEELPYLIKVNRIGNCVTIYRKDERGEYTIPYKAMVCSTGKIPSDTPLGKFRTIKKYTWRKMVDASYGQYAYRFHGPILFHSVPYLDKKKNTLEYEEFNKLGTAASLGCVRLCVRDALWLMSNCPVGTGVVVYDDKNSPGPLGKPEMIHIPEGSPYRNWDPTDPDQENPWLACRPVIHAESQIRVTASQCSDCTLLENLGARATDTCGNDVTDRIEIHGKVDLKKTGKYTIVLKVRDAIRRSAAKVVMVIVEPEQDTVDGSETEALEQEQVILDAKKTCVEVTAGEYQKLSDVFSKMGVSAIDSHGKQIHNAPAQIKTTEIADLQTPGNYALSLSITDAYGKTSDKMKITIAVKGEEEKKIEENRGTSE